MRLIKINKQIFALGFEWRKKEKNKPAEIIQDLFKDKEKFDFITYRKEQYAIAEFTKNYTDINYKKVSSLSASITLPSSSFLGVFCLKDIENKEIYWVLAISQDMILALGDKIFNSKAEAEAYLPTLKSLANYETELVRDNEVESILFIESLINKRFFYPKLHLVDQHTGKVQTKTILLTCIIIFIALGFVFFNWYLDNKAKQEQLLLLQKQQEYRQKVLANPSQHFNLVWQTALSVQDMSSSCLSSILVQPLFYNAWELNSAFCSANELKITWLQSVRSDYLELPPNASLESSTKAVSTMPLVTTKLKPRQDKDLQSLLNKDEAERNVYQITTNFKLNSKILFAPLEKKILEEGIELVAPFMIGNFALLNINTLTLLDQRFIQALAMPGLVTESFESSKNTWTIKGKIYVKTQK